MSTDHLPSSMLSRPRDMIFSGSTQLNVKFKLLIKIKMLKNKDVLLSNPHMLYLPLTFMSMINFMLSKVENENKFYNLRPWSH